MPVVKIIIITTIVIYAGSVDQTVVSGNPDGNRLTH